MRRFAVVYLLAEAAGTAGWWVLLVLWPASREPFLVRGAPDATLLAFGLADALFVLSAVVAGVGLLRGRPWAWPVLLVHAGAAAYAALYCWLLSLLTSDAWLGVILMTPSLVVPGWLAWRLRPAGGV